MVLDLRLVDAFTDRPFAGNPAAVAIMAAFPPEPLMQAVAAELNLPETAFVVARHDGAFDLRWFTPTVEVDLCGHATLASLHVLLTELAVPGPEANFQTRSGLLSGRRSRDGTLGIDLPRSRVEPVDPSALAGALGEIEELYQAGSQNLLAVVRDYDTLCGLAVDPVSLFLAPGSLVIAACAGAPGADVAIRVFAPRLGVAEDPVTGSALCAVAPWWAERTGAPTIVVRQASARGGLMYARLFERHVEVAGYARTFLSGEVRA